MKQRTTQPSNNKYYIRSVSGGFNNAVVGEPVVKGANVLCNCVGYANGRFNEIINDPELKGISKAFKYQLVCNAENFIESAKNQGLKISPTPVEGGVMVWQKGATLSGSDGAGHVEVVEAVYEDGTIRCSSSGWASWPFRTIIRTNANGNWGQASAYKFRGCIINPAVDGKVVPVPPLTVDGVGGAATVSALQRFLNVVDDGVISGQLQVCKKYFPALTSVTYTGGGSATVKALQKWTGVEADGFWGAATSKALQRKLGISPDGIFGKGSMMALQTFLNTQLNSAEPAQTVVTAPTTTVSTPKASSYKVIDVSYWQKSIDWAKVKADGVVGAIIRYADGDTLDSYFNTNMEKAIANGIHVGCYIFSRAKTAKEAEKEAQRLFNAASIYKPDMPLYIDLEAKGLEKYADTVAAAFLKKMDTLGAKGGVYANLIWFNNYLTNTIKNYSSYPLWIAQYNDRITHKTPGIFGMWQYSSKGSVNGIKGNVDMNHCYTAYWEVPKTEEKVEPVVIVQPSTVSTYPGTMPSIHLEKTTQQVIDDAVIWANYVAADNDFHYGYTNKHGSTDSKNWSPNAHHNGCYFCNTNTDKGGRSKKGIEDFEHTYCCNPFAHAAYAHGGCVPSMLKICQNGGSYDYSKGAGYDKSPLFANKGKLKASQLKKGDICCSDGHIAVVDHDGEAVMVHAHSGDDNKKGSKRWNDSISKSKWTSYTRVYRFIGSVNADMPIRHGEVSNRVADLQKYLTWYGIKLSADRIFGDSTRAAVKQFQTENGLKADGIVGSDTLKKMKAVVK